MTTARGLATLGRLRRREREQARAALAAAALTLRRFEDARRAWRHAASGEAAAATDAASWSLGRWLEAARHREWQGEAHARDLRAALVAAERRYRASERRLAQVEALERAAREAARAQALAREQRALDDLPRRDEPTPETAQLGRSAGR